MKRRSQRASVSPSPPLLAALESEARSLGLDELRLESSLNAAPFYGRHGFAAESRGRVEHADEA